MNKTILGFIVLSQRRALQIIHILANTGGFNVSFSQVNHSDFGADWVGDKSIIMRWFYHNIYSKSRLRARRAKKSFFASPQGRVRVPDYCRSGKIDQPCQMQTSARERTHTGLCKYLVGFFTWSFLHFSFMRMEACRCLWHPRAPKCVKAKAQWHHRSPLVEGWTAWKM